MAILSLHRPHPGKPTGTNARPSSPRGLSGTVTLALLASIVVSFLAGSSAPTPLYATYQAEWGFSPMTTTVVFAIYALAVLTALLTVGRLSDHVGRRPVLFVAIGLQIVSMLIFLSASDVLTLGAARIAQGLSTGAALGALGAAMLDVNARHGTLANAVAPASGTALGSLLSGVLVQYLPWPTHLIFLVLLGVFVLQAAALTMVPESVTRRPGAWRAMRPEIALPSTLRRSFLAAAPILVVVWGLAGLYGSLGPALIHQVVGSTSPTFGGLGFFALAGAGALAVFALRDVSAHRLMLAGIGFLIVGLALTIVAIASASAVAFFVGTAIAGAGFGSGFQGSIRTVVTLAAPHERAGVLSALFTVSYLSFGLPAVVAGVLVVHGGGLTETAEGYAAALIALTMLALGALARTWPAHAHPKAVAEPHRATSRVPEPCEAA